MINAIKLSEIGLHFPVEKGSTKYVLYHYEERSVDFEIDEIAYN